METKKEQNGLRSKMRRLRRVITKEDVVDFYKIAMFLSLLVVVISFSIVILNKNNTTVLILTAVVVLVALSNVYVLLIVKYFIDKFE